MLGAIRCWLKRIVLWCCWVNGVLDVHSNLGSLIDEKHLEISLFGIWNFIMLIFFKLKSTSIGSPRENTQRAWLQFEEDLRITIKFVVSLILSWSYLPLSPIPPLFFFPHKPFFLSLSHFFHFFLWSSLKAYG